ncbi:DUF1540 domain-containing protein [Heliophilum fasciatum]|uniref:Uncharacterized protein DUF1540 n=1 Tax=Heliophilum fasciatum TaxID=35700 RepID=A0A4R2RFU1_9FIRM|nr:DUF1540 domain-containing protein [Heliophilum fasciatum]MCW2278967.1 hypothetical protein [Heliophilum fasciatum]TCP61783.1 uncharacterized protein DUF1540 [Heliophilum fasciatum]
MPDVNCTVNNCHYWDSGNLCTAKQIVVQNDQNGGFSPNAQLSQLTATPAQKNDETCCQTFKNKSFQ